MFWWGLLVVGLIGQPDNCARHLVRLPARCEARSLQIASNHAASEHRLRVHVCAVVALQQSVTA